MAYCFNDDKSKAAVYTKSEADILFSSKAEDSDVEKKVNKRTSIRNISSATDTAYPSEKAVAQALSSKQDTLTIDTSLSSSSTNPVQNKVIQSALASVQNALTNIQNWIPSSHSVRMNDYVTGTSNGTDKGTVGTQTWRKVYTVRTWNSGKKEYFAKIWCTNVGCNMLSHFECTYPSGTFTRPPIIVSSVGSTSPGNSDSVHEYTHQMAVVSETNSCNIYLTVDNTPDQVCDLYVYIHAISSSSDWPS